MTWRPGDDMRVEARCGCAFLFPASCNYEIFRAYPCAMHRDCGQSMELRSEWYRRVIDAQRTRDDALRTELLGDRFYKAAGERPPK